MIHCCTSRQTADFLTVPEIFNSSECFKSGATHLQPQHALALEGLQLTSRLSFLQVILQLRCTIKYLTSRLKKRRPVEKALCLYSVYTCTQQQNTNITWS